MAALTQNRPPNQYGGIESDVLPNRFYLPVAAAVKIYQGALVVVDSSGNANPAGNASGAYVAGVMAGCADEAADNTNGAAGAAFVTVRQGAFYWDISGALTQASWGQKVYAVDDHTVILSNGAPNVTVAGMFIGIDTSAQSITYGQAGVLTILGGFGATT